MGRMPNLLGKKILARDEIGGISLVASGALGTGKTSLMCDITQKLMKRKDKKGRPSDEKFWWRGRSVCQWSKLNGVLWLPSERIKETARKSETYDDFLNRLLKETEEFEGRLR